MTATATIQAIDSTTRAITLRDETGVEDTYVAGPDLKRFDELKVGDTVRMTYTESVFLQLRKAGGAATGTAGAKPADPVPSTRQSPRGKGPLPGHHRSRSGKDDRHGQVDQYRRCPRSPSQPDGRTITRKVEEKKNLDGVSAGNIIDVTYTRALLTQIERAK